MQLRRDLDSERDSIVENNKDMSIKLQVEYKQLMADKERKHEVRILLFDRWKNQIKSG